MSDNTSPDACDWVIFAVLIVFAVIIVSLACRVEKLERRSDAPEQRLKYFE